MCQHKGDAPQTDGWWVVWGFFRLSLKRRLGNEGLGRLPFRLRPPGEFQGTSNMRSPGGSGSNRRLTRCLFFWGFKSRVETAFALLRSFKFDAGLICFFLFFPLWYWLTGFLSGCSFLIVAETFPFQVVQICLLLNFVVSAPSLVVKGCIVRGSSFFNGFLCILFLCLFISFDICPCFVLQSGFLQVSFCRFTDKLM